ncbi:sensor histidine kinase [Micromonospora sp. NBS 11-29]|uniref:sensor histidine kinase n=1 Tax=Micromonospora sp. NBS 11-29 TaxID=1960879 RepID=UPI001593EBC5|nr:HAMP domain-containing sensor histidine kinase [Micromonospora sp. NBS 11-29]
MTLDSLIIKVPRHREPTGRDERLSLRVLCHELRTPVQALTALTRALADRQRPLTMADRQALATLAHEHAEHLRSLLDDLGAPGPGHDARRWRPLADVIHAATATVPDRRLRTRVDRVAAELPVPEQHVRQILTNLAHNALRHGPADGDVVVRAAARPDTLTLSVVDRGVPGPALRAALTRPAPPPAGDGLGLWIVRRLVDAYAGTLSARRTRAGWLAVEVRLPVPLRADPAGTRIGPARPVAREPGGGPQR